MKTAFHLATIQANKVFQALRNVENLHEASLDADIAVVVNTSAVKLLCEGSEFEDRVRELAEKGVDFKACRNSIDSTDASVDDIMDEADVVGSGVGELSRLQDEGYGYIKP